MDRSTYNFRSLLFRSPESQRKRVYNYPPSVYSTIFTERVTSMCDRSFRDAVLALLVMKLDLSICALVQLLFAPVSPQAEHILLVGAMLIPSGEPYGALRARAQAKPDAQRQRRHVIAGSGALKQRLALVCCFVHKRQQALSRCLSTAAFYVHVHDAKKK